MSLDLVHISICQVHTDLEFMFKKHPYCRPALPMFRINRLQEGQEDYIDQVDWSNGLRESCNPRGCQSLTIEGGGLRDSCESKEPHNLGELSPLGFESIFIIV